MRTESFTEALGSVIDTRAQRPGEIAERAKARSKRTTPFGAKELIIAADHPARGTLRAGSNPMAMANRAELLRRLCVALARPGVTGVLGTADILEDLLLLGALENRTVFASMNRGGLAGASFEVDDRFTAYNAKSIQDFAYDGGKMLLRVDLSDDRTARTLESCAQAVNELADRGLTAMVEPFMSTRVDGKLKNDLSVESATLAMTIAAGLGHTSAHTWLKVPVIGDGADDMAQVLSATTLPTLLLGGEVSTDATATYARWGAALRHPTVRGLVVGRSLLYPPDDDVAGAVDTAAGLL